MFVYSSSVMLRYFLGLSVIVAVQSGWSATPGAACDVVGGGAGYSSGLQAEEISGVVTVDNYESLMAAVNGRAPYIFVPGSASITLPNAAAALRIYAGQTVFGDRGRQGSPGGLLMVPASDADNKHAVIQLESGARISGLRIQGPSSEAGTASQTIGMQLLPGSRGVVVDNNEIYNWPWAGVSVKQSTDNRIHHNYVHHNIRSELGYGIVVQNGNAEVEIQCNVFDANRHAIAGSGEAGERYWAHDNLVLNGGGRGAYHQFDMHAGSTGLGGQSVHISDNIFDFGRYGSSNRSSVGIRGIPGDGTAIVTANLFTQGWNVGTQVAVSGVAGAVESDTTLQQSNSFNSPVTYHTNGLGGCFMTLLGGQVPVNCMAIGR